MQPVFEIAGQTYRFDGMTGVVETRVLRRFSPLIAHALPLVIRKGRQPGVPVELRPDIDAVKFATVVFDRFGTLSDPDQDMIHRVSLGAVSRQVGSDWHQVWSPEEAEPAFPDLNGALIMRLTLCALGHVVRQWFETFGEEIPAEIRAAAAKLH